MAEPSVSFVWSGATLLQGGIDDCKSHDDDDTCVGGVAALMALLRHYSEGIDDAALVINRLDFATPFVQMHPLGRGVNRLILEDHFGLDAYYAFRSLIAQTPDISPRFARDIATLRSTGFRPLLGNLLMSTKNPWHKIATNIKFDKKTGLAVLVVDDGDDPDVTVGRGNVLRVDQIESTQGLLDFIYSVNEANGCTGPSLGPYFDYLASINRTVSDITSEDPCWIPVVVYAAPNEAKFAPFLEAITEYEHAPSFILNAASWDDFPIQQVGSQGTWVAKFSNWPKGYYQWRLELSADRRSIVNVSLIEDRLFGLRAEARDEAYIRDHAYIRRLAEEAGAHDPVLGYSDSMPSMNFDVFRPCMGGECPVGNLFADAMRWRGDADFAFTNSGGLRGDGWDAGPVKVSNIWDSFPFDNTLCTGVMTGLSVFRLFNYSTSLATFQTEYTSTGDRLMQISGARITYNTELEGSRLIAIEIMNGETGVYESIERLKYYKFATDSWNCGGFDPFPSLLSSKLVIEGEEPGSTGSLLIQTITGDYLAQLNEPYDTNIQGRLVNNTEVTEPMNWIQSKDSCKAGTYWDASFLSCFSCPVIGNVTFDKEMVEFMDVSGSETLHPGQMQLVNDDDTPVSIVLKSKPNWIEFGDEGLNELQTLEPGQRVLLDFTASAYFLEEGTAQGSVSFGVLDGGTFPGCTGTDATFDVKLRAAPRPELFKPGGILIVGLTLMSILVVLSLLCGGIVQYHREHRVVRAMQPEFLQVLCIGICVVALSVLPMSLEDEIASQAGRDMACMASPWLLSLGFTVIMSALFVKLRRINTVMNSGFRHAKVTAQEAAVPFCIFFGINSVLLTIWTVVDPLRWELRITDEDESHLYGSCSDFGTGGWTMMALTLLVNFSALALACLEAYKARHISADFSESKSLGHALFSWTQIIFVGTPVLSLISEDNPSAKYFLQVSLIFAACLSMLLLIFGQIFFQLRSNEASARGEVRISGISFATGPYSSDGFGSHTRTTRNSTRNSTGSNAFNKISTSSLVAEVSTCGGSEATNAENMSSDREAPTSETPCPAAVGPIVPEGPLDRRTKTIPEDCEV